VASGYPSWIYSRADWDDPVAKRLFGALHRNAVTVGSDAVAALGDAARGAGAHVVVGATERDDAFSRGTLFNSQLHLTAGGELAGVHRKLVATHPERIVWGAGDGSSLRVWPASFARVGGLICWEHWMPLARFAMHAQGEQVHVAAWPSMPEIHELACRHYAFEGRCYVLCAAGFLRARDLPLDAELRAAMPAGDPVMDGGSGIIGPDGNWLAGPVRGSESIVFADIDLRRVAEEQQALDTAGHYNRPDVFDVRIDSRPHPPFAWRDSEQG
jgi:nitrilase